MWDYTKLLSDSLSKKAPELANVLDPNADRVAALEELVQRLLATQHQVANSITERVSAVPGLPKPVLEMTEQMHSVAETMLKLQGEVWSGWFGILRQLQGAATAEPAVPPEGKKGKTAASAPTPAEAEATDAAASAVPQPAPAEVDATTSAVPAPAAPSAPATSEADVDDLKAINGVGPAIERKLNQAGVFNYRQIAHWTEDDIERIETTVMTGRFAGKIRREDWIGQAKSLMG